ncbi:MAG: hypothetical protein ABFD76_06740 [Smithella sp.]
MKKYFDLPEKREVIAIESNTGMVTAELLALQRKTIVREIDGFTYADKMREYKHPHQGTFWEEGKP